MRAISYKRHRFPPDVIRHGCGCISGLRRAFEMLRNCLRNAASRSACQYISLMLAFSFR